MPTWRCGRDRTRGFTDHGRGSQRETLGEEKKTAVCVISSRDSNNHRGGTDRLRGDG
ncbi:hypothetical protein GS506_06035 [Rhodococcus hoagii]|nr:hypothetical protein [Prescottella equi]